MGSRGLGIVAADGDGDRDAGVVRASLTLDAEVEDPLERRVEERETLGVP
jgi:hypothetical protein